MFFRHMERILLVVFLITILFVIKGNGQVMSNVGTDFWIAFPPNWQNPSNLYLYISSTNPTSGSVYSAYPGVNQDFTVAPGVITTISLPSGVVIQEGLIEDKGIRITSGYPITVYALNSYNASTDAFLGLPVSALGMDYRLASYQVFIPSNSSRYTVVATTDSTHVNVHNSWLNSDTSFTLNQGQTFMNADPESGMQDITGSRIQADHPIAVLGSNDCVYIPDYSCQACDHIVEQMFPAYALGRNFLTVPLAGRDNSGDVFRVVAAGNGTVVSVNDNPVTTLNAGEYYQTFLTGYNSISASNPVLLAQYAKGLQCSGNISGDPFMMLIPPREQFLKDYTFYSLTGFSMNWVNVVAPDYAIGSIFQDGLLIPPSAFTPIPTTGYSGAQRPVTSGTHNFHSTYPFGVFVYGWDLANSYGYPGGCSLAQGALVYNISLSPDTVYAQLNLTLVCITATVTDTAGQPVPGVLVTFFVTGISPQTGSIHTDILGHASISYIQTGTVPGIDHVTAEAFGINSDTSVVFWSYGAPCVNPSNAGTIGSNQSGCEGFLPDTIISILPASGQTGTLEYRWQLSVTDSISGFTDIPESHDPWYQPGTISQNTWFRRLARVSCMPDWNGAAVSNVILITVSQLLPVSVTVTSSASQVCAGDTVIFNAIPVNGGTNPSFQWKVNGNNTGINSNLLSLVPADSDSVTCLLTSSETCTYGNPAVSNVVGMTIYPILPVTVSISASSNPFCLGDTVLFLASLVNGGNAPAFQWMVNGLAAGTNSAALSYPPAAGDEVSCIMTSSDTCTSGSPAVSNTIAMTGYSIVPAGVSITAGENPFCPGNSITFTATPVNGGTDPVYQWRVNGVNAGSNSPVLTYTPADGDIVSCLMNSGLVCVSGNPASSNLIVMNGSLAPVVTFTPCFDTILTTNAQPFSLRGGIPLGGIYTGPGVTPETGIFNPAVAGAGTKTITYTYTNVALCPASAMCNVHCSVPAAFSCGNDLTDIRDGKNYSTIQIGGRCWMAENLDYGNMVWSTKHQRNNCIPEKYCFNDDPSLCTLHYALYQWDELMQYGDTPGTQGLCPPGWHVPSEADWTILFSNWINNGFSASPLKYTGYSGFNALLSGVSYLNQEWKFEDFATFFWSSTPHGATKSWAHGMNKYDPSVSSYPSLRSNAFSVRCVMD